MKKVLRIIEMGLRLAALIFVVALSILFPIGAAIKIVQDFFGW